jgi:tetratricopeptide (TPR) repeat protein
MALEMTPSALSADARRRRAGLGQVLEWAGRGTDAAAVYLEAAESAPGLERVEFEQRAAEQLLATGRIDDGLAVLDRGLSLAGIRRPRSAVGAIFWLLVYRLWLRIGGVRFVERDPSQVERIARAKIDMLYAVGLGLSVVDIVHAACMQARHVVLALRAGDPFQVLRAAAIEVATLASAGGKVTPIERDLAGLVERLGQGAHQLEGRAFGVGANGVALFLRGEWRRSLEVLDSAFAAYPNNRAGWHANGRLFAIWALTYLGRFDEFRRRHAALLADAEQRGDLYTTVGLRIGCSSLAWLVEDDVDSARRHVKVAMAEWSARGFHVQHYRAMVADANVALYEGDGEQAYERLARDWKKLEKSFVLRVQYVRADAWFARARAALARAKGSRAPGPDLAEAERIARRLAKENMPWIDVLAGIVRAGVARLRGDAKTSTDLLQRTLVEAEAADMAMHAAAIRRQLGLLAGNAGRGLVEQADAGLTSQGVRAPERFAAMLVLDL